MNCRREVEAKNNSQLDNDESRRSLVVAIFPLHFHFIVALRSPDTGEVAAQKSCAKRETLQRARDALAVELPSFVCAKCIPHSVRVTSLARRQCSDATFREAYSTPDRNQHSTLDSSL